MGVCCSAVSFCGGVWGIWRTGSQNTLWREVFLSVCNYLSRTQFLTQSFSFEFSALVMNKNAESPIQLHLQTERSLCYTTEKCSTHTSDFPKPLYPLVLPITPYAQSVIIPPFPSATARSTYVASLCRLRATN